jgi:hypothetical protein
MVNDVTAMVYQPDLEITCCEVVVHLHVVINILVTE